MNAGLLIITLLLIVSCSNESSQLTDITDKGIKALAKHKSSIEPLPAPLKRNPFIFQSLVSKPATTIPWQGWKLLGTFVVDTKARHALLTNPDGASYLFSRQSELPETGWTIAKIESQSITFVNTDGFFYSVRSKQQ